MKLVPNWKHSWKWFSTQVHVAQAAIVSTWLALPPDLKSYLPAKVLVGVVGFLGVIGVIGRVIDQSKPE